MEIRNFCIIAHIDHGKSTLADRMLELTGTVQKREMKAQLLDKMELEREKGITIKLAPVQMHWKTDSNTQEYELNLIDTPGHVDFTVEVERSLRVLDGAVAVFDASQGVEPQSETVWHQADKYNVPRVAFINKMDKLGADFYMSLDSIKERLSTQAYPIQLPIGQDSTFSGIVDIIEQKAYKFEGDKGQNIVEIPIPDDLKDKVKEYRGKLLEKAAEANDDFMNKFINGTELTIDEIKQGIRTLTIRGEMYAVLCGSALANIGVQLMLDAVVSYLPAPTDVPAIKGHNPDDETQEEDRKVGDNEPFCALAFKIATDPFVGKLIFFRVYSGTVKAGSYVYNSSKGEKERLGRIVRMHANSREDVDEVYAGEIAAAIGLKDVGTGDTLCDENKPIKTFGIKIKNDWYY
jgi:elongation factor G